jgi:hypothetical protein
MVWHGQERGFQTVFRLCIIQKLEVRSKGQQELHSEVGIWNATGAGLVDSDGELLEARKVAVDILTLGSERFMVELIG